MSSMANDPKVPGSSKDIAANDDCSKSGSTESKNKSSSSSAGDTTQLGYIEPLERKLGPLQAAVNEPVSSLNVADPVKFQLRKLVGLLIASGKHKPGFSLEFVEEVSDLTTQFMSFFVDSLHKLTEVQRHHKPGISDLQMCLSAQNVTATDLYNEYVRTKELDPNVTARASDISKDLDSLLREYRSDNYTLEKDDPSLVFHANEQHEIAALVPRQALKRDYIPHYLPDLPPDFTFTSTGSYMNTTTDLKEIKLKLAEESRLNEASLYTLIDDDERRWRSSLEKEIAELESSDSESAVSDVMSKSGEKEGTDIESPVVAPVEHPEDEKKDIPAKEEPKSEHPNQFDFVAYAEKRRRARERYLQEMERRRKARNDNIFMKAEQAFSPYAKHAPTSTEVAFFETFLGSSFKRVIKATRSAEQRKKQKQELLLEEKKRIAEEQGAQSGDFEFGFAFNPGTNVSDDSDEEEQPNTLMEFDFGDAAEADEHDSALNGIESEVEDKSVLETDDHAVSQSPQVGQVAGKAPIKEPSHANGQESSEVNADDMFDDISDVEGELEHHMEDLQNGIDTEMADAALEAKSEKEPGTHVTWGGLASEESEEDEFEDIEQF